MFKHVYYRYYVYNFIYIYIHIYIYTPNLSNGWLLISGSHLQRQERLLLNPATLPEAGLSLEKPIHGPVGPLCEFMKLQYNATQIHNKRLLEIFANNFKSAVD